MKSIEFALWVGALSQSALYRNRVKKCLKMKFFNSTDVNLQVNQLIYKNKVRRKKIFREKTVKKY